MSFWVCVWNSPQSTCLLTATSEAWPHVPIIRLQTGPTAISLEARCADRLWRNQVNQSAEAVEVLVRGAQAGMAVSVAAEFWLQLYSDLDWLGLMWPHQGVDGWGMFFWGASLTTAWSPTQPTAVFTCKRSRGGSSRAGCIVLSESSIPSARCRDGKLAATLESGLTILYPLEYV